MRRIVFAALLIALINLPFGVVVEASHGEEGTFILFLGGVEAGREQFRYSETGLEIAGEISLGGQTLTIKSSLSGSVNDWGEYQATLTPGAHFSAKFKQAAVEFEVGPLKRNFPLQKPYVVLDNNVFAHYEQMLVVLPEGRDQASLAVVVPSLVLANQNPVIQGEIKRTGEVFYTLTNGTTLSLQEFIITMPGNLQIRLLGNGQGEMILLEIPMQLVQVVRDGYIGLSKVEGPKEKARHWVEEEFSVQNGSISLTGTLALPLGSGPFPAVLLNSGSGPQDRAGNTPPFYMTNMFTIMAEKLTQAGVAVLRYDERGVGASTGDYDAASLKDLLSDVYVLLGFLEKHPAIDQSRIGMVGHSEGAYFAPVFAERLGALVLLAGPSIPLDEIMVEQLDYQEEQPWLSAQERAILKDYRPQLQKLLAEARGSQETSQVLPLNLEWLREHMRLDPMGNIAKVTAPVLIVHGEKDLKVMPYHAEELARTLQAAGNKQVTVRYLEETTHEFTFFPYDNPDFDPLDPLRLNPRLFEIVVDWLSVHL